MQDRGEGRSPLPIQDASGFSPSFRLPEGRVKTFDEKQHVATKTRPLCIYFSLFFFFLHEKDCNFNRQEEVIRGWFCRNGIGK